MMGEIAVTLVQERQFPMARILIVDDDAALLRLLDLMLRRENHSVTLARSAREALKYLDQSPVDMVITDILMPQVDGFTLISWLRADGRYKHLPIAVLTASGRKHMANKAIENGANGFLLKPFSSWELKKTVADCLGVNWDMRCDHAQENCYCSMNIIPIECPIHRNATQ
jgi:CheY-like chemotaxis protein